MTTDNSASPDNLRSTSAHSPGYPDPAGGLETSRGTGLWRNRNFRLLWLAESISLLGSQVSFLALPLVAALTLDASPFQMGLLGAMSGLPALLLGLPAGVWVDRGRRRPILLLADVGRAALLLTIPIAAQLGMLHITQLYLVAAGIGALSLLFTVAYRSYLPSIVGRGDLVEGNSRLELSRSVAEIGGPGLAGGLVALATAPLAILADAISFLLSATFISRITHRETAASTHPESQIGREIVEGLRLVWRTRVLRDLTAATGTINLFNAMLEGVFILYITRSLGLSPLTIGLIFSAGSVGFIVGALFAGRFSRSIGVGRTIIAAILLTATSDLLVPLVSDPDWLVVGLLILAQGCFGIGITVFGVTQVSLRQAVTPDGLLGRMNATVQVVSWGLAPIGALIGGVLGEIIGLRATLVLAAIGEMMSVGWLIRSPIQRLRSHAEIERFADDTQPDPGMDASTSAS